MPGCTWCQTHWECDGEGGEGCSPGPDSGPPHVRPPNDCKPGPPPHWEIHDGVELKYEDGKRVIGPGGPIIVKVDTQHPGIQIDLNTKRVPPGNDGQGQHAPGGRVWQINREVSLMDAAGQPVLDKAGNPVKVRVQAYLYTKGAGHPTEACEGIGPKLCLYAVKP